jgi:hypothetical protein
MRSCTSELSVVVCKLYEQLVVIYLELRDIERYAHHRDGQILIMPPCVVAEGTAEKGGLEEEEDAASIRRAEKLEPY